MRCELYDNVDGYCIVHVSSHVGSQYNGIIIASISVAYSMIIHSVQNRDKHYLNSERETTTLLSTYGT